MSATRPRVVVASLGTLFMLTFSAQAAPVNDEPPAQLGSYVDCQDSCRDCQRGCESKSAGSERSDCYRSCTAAAAGCCSGYGKRPPSGLTCTCQ